MARHLAPDRQRNEDGRDDTVRCFPPDNNLERQNTEQSPEPATPGYHRSGRPEVECPHPAHREQSCTHSPPLETDSWTSFTHRPVSTVHHVYTPHYRTWFSGYVSYECSATRCPRTSPTAVSKTLPPTPPLQSLTPQFVTPPCHLAYPLIPQEAQAATLCTHHRCQTIPATHPACDLRLHHRATKPRIEASSSLCPPHHPLHPPSTFTLVLSMHSVQPPATTLLLPPRNKCIQKRSYPDHSIIN